MNIAHPAATDTPLVTQVTPLKLIVGYRNYQDLDYLRQGIEDYNHRLAAQGTPSRPLRITSAQQDAQKVYNDAVIMEADLVLLDPDMDGYHHGLLNELLLYEKRPIPVIGWFPARSDQGRALLNNGAKVVIQLPLDEQGLALFLQNAERVVNEAWRDRAAGKAVYGSAFRAGGGDRGYQRKTIAVWVPKGGGSTRTTIATNLAVALSHNRFGGVPTMLVDMDMTKGDCHTLLGYTVDPAESARTGALYLDQGLHTLFTWAARDYERKQEAALTQGLIRKFTTTWRPGEAQLHLLPGLLSPTLAAAEEFQDWQMLYTFAVKLLAELRALGMFVVCDLGQDFTAPLHRAALEAADEVLVCVPPARTAVVDTVHALPALANQLGSLAKFKLVITAYAPNFGMGEREIVDAIGLPLLARIPHDAELAHQAMNRGEPFVLSDAEGPLGQAILGLAGVYLPGLGKPRGGNPLKGLFSGFGKAARRAVLAEA